MEKLIIRNKGDPYYTIFKEAVTTFYNLLITKQ
jgi:hypothetical protein